MKSTSVSTTSTLLTDSKHPTVAPDLTADLPMPVSPTVYQSEWFVALMLVVILANRLHQVLVTLLYLLRAWKPKSNSEIK